MLSLFKKNDSSSINEPWLSFSLNVSLVILLFILGIFIGIYHSQKNLIEAGYLIRARSHFQNIVTTREWNAQHGGVYVKKTQGMVSNPYLERPDIVSREGITYTLKNPALMTREISEIAAKNDEFHFHITSLKPLNPNNAADAFEKGALLSFEEGLAEAYGKHEEAGKHYFRYMAPLRTQEACLKCHAQQGYQIGDVRGGISVTFNIDEIETSMYQNRIIMIILYGVTSITLIGVISIFILRLNKKLTVALTQIQKLAVTDHLTGLHNRRYLLERLEEEMMRCKRYNHPMSCLLLDIDFFKRINDTYGHRAGDAVLIQFSKLLRTHSRKSDLISRYGGEEFIVILAETEENTAVTFAEKIRTLVENEKFNVDEFIQVSVTTSIGVVSFTSQTNESVNVDTLINHADRALYSAKASGRNRVEKIAL